MKTSILNLRLNTNTREALDEVGIAQNKSASAVARDAIDSYLSLSHQNDFLDTAILQTFGFAELIFWIMDKRFDPDDSECPTLYEQHVKLITEMESHPIFPENLMVEFRKVQRELIRCINGENGNSYFEFPNSGGFDYMQLHDFMHTVRFDENDERVVYIK